MYKFKINDLKCLSCFHNIEETLKEKDPTLKASADIKNQLLEVESTESVEKIIGLIEESGYQVSEVTAG